VLNVKSKANSVPIESHQFLSGCIYFSIIFVDTCDNVIIINHFCM